MSAPTSRVLDPASGGRMMYFDRENPDVIFGDIRSEVVSVTDRSHGRIDGVRSISILPDATMDFRDLPYEDGTFNLVVFDPPHMVRAGEKSWLAAKYGVLKIGVRISEKDFRNASAFWSPMAS